MSDEIDIEEHDVMDNPKIRRMFPDLSVIKKEINQYYDEVVNVPSESALEELCEGDATTDSEAQLPKHIHNSNELVTASSFHASEAESQKASSSNIILLGSKPSLGSKKSNNYRLRKEPRILLKNVNSFLNSCRRYCKECLILFPKPKLFNLHSINVHRKGKIQTEFIERKLSNTLYKCNACHRLLASKGNLFRHFRNLHGDVKSLKMVDVSDNKIKASKASESKATSGLSCFHCQQLFPTQSSLIEHLYEVLEPNKIGHSDSTRSANSKEANKEVNFNNKLVGDECLDDLNENKNSPSANSRIPDLNNGNYEGTPPQKNNLRRRSSIVGLGNCNDENIKKKKHIDTANSNPLQRQDSNACVGLKTNEFNKCKKQFNSDNKLKHHIRSMHRKRSKNKSNNIIKSNTRKETFNLKSFKKPLQAMFYKCFICSKYMMTFKNYSRHIMTDHNIKEISEIEKVPFDSQCNFCPSKPSDSKCYNVHLYKFHYEKIKRVYFPHDEQPVIENHEKIDKKIQFALKSILYKCMKCDLFFFSCNAAGDHSKHLEISDTCECSICQRTFRSENMLLHKKQHSFSQTFTVHTITDSTLSRVLYKCSNCTVHYSEENFLLHYTKCDSETPNSIYCKVCDILINRDDMESHGINHREKKKRYSDFIIIESDMIDDRHISPSTTKTKNSTRNRYKKSGERSDENSKLALNFCQTCKCFISNVNLRKLHIEGKCGHMLKCVCKDCGLMFTMKSHATHKQHHKKEQISLHDYLFFDLKSKERICPPIPDYPKCNSCGVHFLRNSDIKIHLCQEQDYITCNVCSMKLIEHAYKLHMHFHSYSIKNDTKLKDSNLQSNSANKISCNELNSSLINGSFFTNVMFFYTCKSCQLTVITYDKVVQHCQDHYDSTKVQLDMQKCQNCSLILHRSDYDSHINLHSNGKINNDSIKVIDFDPFYFSYNNGFWSKHIFAYVGDEDISKIRRTSIYRYECRLKMEEIQSGSFNLVLYRCDKCQVFIDPQSLYMHAVHSGDKSCVKLRKHSCVVCGSCFGSLSYRIAHEKEHESMDIDMKSYKIVIFNKEEDEIYNKIMYDVNNRYILYQCRNCERVVDKFERNTHKCDENNLKVCSTCGLVLDKHDFDLHFIRHEELDKFNADNIIIVMFGKLCSHGKRKKLRSTFSGFKYDFTLYKCKKCDLCLKTKKCKSEHVCVFDDSKVKCSKCGLNFSKLDVKSHYLDHESNLYIDDLILNIITFDTSSENFHIDPIDKLGEKDLKQTKEIIESTSFSSEKLEVIYKCVDCGLHFLEELSAQQHLNICNARMKISKQSCIKCDLLFTPGELFNHLLKHHCDKKLKFKFDIVLVSKRGKK